MNTKAIEKFHSGTGFGGATSHIHSPPSPTTTLLLELSHEYATSLRDKN